MVSATRSRSNGPPIRDWRPRTVDLLARQLLDDEDRVDAGLITEAEAKAREFAVWTAAESAGADVVEMLK
jgi:hypothetical protein